MIAFHNGRLVPQGELTLACNDAGFVAGTTITPFGGTGDIGLRISDTATDAWLDETKPSASGPAALMADLTVNAVSIKLSALTGAGRDPAGPYSTRNTITFDPSDKVHPPLTRTVGELITGVTDDFNVPPPNNAFNPTFRGDLAVPANSWTDRLVAPAGMLNVADNLTAIDVNRFVGAGVPQLPRRLTAISPMILGPSGWPCLSRMATSLPGAGLPSAPRLMR